MLIKFKLKNSTEINDNKKKINASMNGDINQSAVETNGSGSRALATRRHTLSKVGSLLTTSKSFKMDTEV